MRRSRVENGNVILLIESAAAGLAFGSLLWWASVCLVAIFRPQRLAAPYWSSIPGLRTDTSGFCAFLVAAACMAISEYLRLRRSYGTAFRSVDDRQPPTKNVVFDQARLISQAVCKSVKILGAGLVCYLSLSTVTHPSTQDIQATHLFSWPTEGTLRIIALIACVLATSILRFLHQRPVFVASSSINVMQ